MRITGIRVDRSRNFRRWPSVTGDDRFGRTERRWSLRRAARQRFGGDLERLVFGGNARNSSCWRYRDGACERRGACSRRYDRHSVGSTTLATSAELYSPTSNGWTATASGAPMFLMPSLPYCQTATYLVAGGDRGGRHRDECGGDLRPDHQCLERRGRLAEWRRGIRRVGRDASKWIDFRHWG